MRKIFKIHPLTYILILLVVFTAHFRLYFVFMLLIIIHELGHVITALLFNWKLKKIIFLPMGMITKFDSLVNVPLCEEIIVASMGVIFQLVFYLLFFKGHIYYDICNLVIIVFNLLPIYPLDGSKIINVLLNKIFSFKNSYLISFYLSLLLITIVLVITIIYKDLIMIIAFIPLLIGLFKEYKQISSIINKFYLERYLYKLQLKKTKPIKGIKISKMKRDFYHFFITNNKIYKEDEILRKLFDKW